jgi:hypothetical protein
VIILTFVSLVVAIGAGCRWLMAPPACRDCGRLWTDRIHLPCAVVVGRCQLGHHPYVGGDDVPWGRLAMTAAVFAGCAFWAALR